MKRRSLVACLSLASVFAIGADAALPEPPRQNEAWDAEPVSGAPEYIPELVGMLFHAGLADPRGGEYRQIELTIPYGDDRSVTTHGWYFPQGFAVCWDGLAHRVAHVGENADLWGDVSAAHAKFWREGILTAPPDAELVGVALLLRLNETELARRLLSKVPTLPGAHLIAPESERRNRDKVNWFQVAGTSWLSGAFHQAVAAHAAGEDRLAIDISESLLRARPAFEAAWKELGPVPGTEDRSPVEFLDPVSALMADSQRRLKEPPRTKFDPALLRGMAPAERIAALIDRLEDVNERQLDEPGGVSMMGSPICKMLAAEGADAVDPLLDVLDHDQRLTRSFSFGRDFFPSRDLISVSDTAEAVLRDYYQLDVFRWTDPAERRAWLLRNKLLSLAERSFDLLADDSNDEIQWLDAARMLLKANKRGSGLVGDELRGRQNPSVSELLAKRAAEMKTNWAHELALLLYRWDPQASLPALQMVAHGSALDEHDGRIAAARLQLGDPAAAREWSASIKGDQIESLDHLAPLWTAPGDETLQALARKLFTDPGAPMSPSGMLAAGQFPLDLLRSPLLIVPAFRDRVLADLQRTEPIGTAERLSDGELEVKTTVIMMSLGLDNSQRRPPGKRSIRLGDFFAWQLSRIDGFPNFDMEWATDEKDRGIAAISDFLRTHASDLRVTANAEGVPAVSLTRN